jgi:hypothetical protein
MPTQEQAEKAWKHGNKGKQYYDAMTEEQKKAMWQYGFDRKLIDTSKLGPGAKAEYQKYVNPSQPEYAMQASIVEKPKQYIQTQNEKITSAVTPQGIKNMISQSPEQIATKRVETPKVLTTADKRRLLNERNLGKYDPQEKVQTTGKAGLAKVPTASNRMIPVGKAGIIKTQARDFNGIDAALLGTLDSATLGAMNIRDDAAIKENSGAFKAGQIGGYLIPYGTAAKAVKPVVGKIANTVLRNVTEGAIAGGGVQALENTIQGKSLEQNAKETGAGMVIGAGIDALLPGAGKLAKRVIDNIQLGKLSKIPVSEVATTVENGLKPATLKGTYKVKNTALDKALNEYNEAIETIQNHFKTNELRTDEMARIKPELGIDLNAILKNIRNAEKSVSVSEIGQRRNLSNVAGVTDLPKINKTVLKPPISEVKPLSNINTPPIENKSLTGALKPLKNNVPSNAAKTVKEAVSKAPTKKDISGFQAYTTDVYRNFEQVFGEDYPAVKKDILDPFNNAKKAKTVEDRQLMGNLKKNIVDKFNIQKGSKDSALIQQFGEKRISESELISKVGKAKADNIKEADKWFRSEYDRLIDDVNKAREAVYPNNPEKIIPHRTDYYRHFKELSDDFAGLKNIFETPSQISPSLAGTSEFTKPKSKFLSFAQKRGDGKFTDDAVGGFLDYINAATYAKHIDTQIPNFRGLAADLAETTEQSKNMNNFIGYLTDFSNDLAGKTNPADRFAQKIIPGGRMTFKAINWLNSRVKANTVLGNLSSSLSQLANIPQGIAYVKNPVLLSKGAGNYMASIFGKGDADLYKKSGFLLERYADNVARQFDVKILDQPKKTAAWMLGAMDEVGTKTIWSSVYQKALAGGVSDPIKYADDITRKLVAGRGIGEVPLLQKSKLMQLVAPFTVEVNNLWKVQKDFIKAKDFGGLVLLYLANFAFNKGMEEIKGDGVVFDPIQAMYDAATEKDLSPVERAGRLGGEILSNVPLGSTLATMYPETGINNEFVSLPTREKLFGRNDPTRFGTGLLVAKGIQDPLYKVLPSFGGGQIKKTVQAGQDLNLLPKLKKEEGKLIPKLEKQDFPASYSNTKQGDRLRATVDPSAGSIAKGLMFGRSAIPELKEYYMSGIVPFSTIQTDNFKSLVNKGYEPNKLFKTLNSIRGTNKKADIVVKLRENGYNSSQIAEIWEVFYK